MDSGCGIPHSWEWHSWQVFPDHSPSSSDVLLLSNCPCHLKHHRITSSWCSCRSILNASEADSPSLIQDFLLALRSWPWQNCKLQPYMWCDRAHCPGSTTASFCCMQLCAIVCWQATELVQKLFVTTLSSEGNNNSTKLLQQSLEA